MGLTWRDFVRPGTSLAVTCSVFLALAAVMTSLVRFGVVGDTIPNVSNFNSTFDPSFLVAKWTWERSVFSWMLVADFCAAAGLMLLIATAYQLRKIYRSHEGVAHRAMYYCFVVGGFLPVVEFLQTLGVVSMADWMTDPTSTWKLTSNDGALQALDVAFKVTVSRSLWVYSLGTLLLGAGMATEYYLENRNQKGHGLKKHSYLALSIAGVAFLAWILELASFWSPVGVLWAAGISMLCFVGGLCAWCLWLAFAIFPNFVETAPQRMEYI